MSYSKALLNEHVCYLAMITVVNSSLLRSRCGIYAPVLNKDEN